MRPTPTSEYPESVTTWPRLMEHNAWWGDTGNYIEHAVFYSIRFQNLTGVRRKLWTISHHLLLPRIYVDCPQKNAVLYDNGLNNAYSLRCIYVSPTPVTITPRTKALEACEDLYGSGAKPITLLDGDTNLWTFIEGQITAYVVSISSVNKCISTLLSRTGHRFEEAAIINKNILC